MGKVHLLTGEPRIGKTTLLKSFIDSVGKEKCGGFVTEEWRQGDERVGFDICTLDGKRVSFASIFSKSRIRVGKYGIDLNAFEAIAITAIDEAINLADYVIIDEIGPMQLQSLRFKQSILDTIESSKSLLGTVVLRSHSWADKLKQHRSVQIYHLTKDNRNDPSQILKSLGQ
ncbi:MAG TPA: nucleoside-triphosphatase [Chloroflexota bacterium]|nr:nucleoside-triphosphatase [Chloroflexota bacterium]